MAGEHHSLGFAERTRARRKRAARSRIPRVFAVFSALVLAAPPPADSSGSETAQRILLDEWGVSIEFREADRKVASEVASICRKTIPGLALQLRLAAIQPFRVFLLSDVRVYEERTGLTLPSWGVAFAFPANDIMLVDVGRATKEWDTLDKVIPHELSHLLLHQRAGDVPFPLWFMEGLAQWQAGEWTVMESWRLMEAVWGNRAPALGQVVSYMPAEESRARDAYRISYAAFQYRFEERTDAAILTRRSPRSGTRPRDSSAPGSTNTSPVSTRAVSCCFKPGPFSRSRACCSCSSSSGSGSGTGRDSSAWMPSIGVGRRVRNDRLQ